MAWWHNKIVKIKYASEVGKRKHAKAAKAEISVMIKQERQIMHLA